MFYVCFCNTVVGSSWLLTIWQKERILPVRCGTVGFHLLTLNKSNIADPGLPIFKRF
jgi:hypothetical protein